MHQIRGTILFFFQKFGTFWEYKAQCQKTKVLSVKDSALELRQRFNQSRSRLTDPIDGFHFYLYSGSTRSIADGGQDMYDGGNEVKILF